MKTSEQLAKNFIQDLINKRKASENDAMSIIFFGSKARIHAKNLHPSKISKLPDFLLSGTDFTLAFKEIMSIMALADEDQIPIIIFLTDGQDTV